MIKAMLLAGCGGFVGTCGRYLVGKWCSGMWHGSFPMGTFMVNIIGCFIIGIFFGLLEKAHVMTPGENVLLITGFCGGFTTFSSFADDMWVYILTEKWAGLSFKNGPPERAYKVNKIMRRCHCSDLVFNHLLSLFEPV